MLEEALSQTGVDPLVARLAANNIKNKQVVIVGFSGKIGTGKDTIAPRVVSRVEEIFELNNPTPAQEYFASPLKREVSEFISTIEEHYRAEGSLESEEFRSLLREQFNMTDTHLDDTVPYVAVELEADHFGLNGWSRTPSIRKLLQYWGTDLRRSQDTEYWTKKALIQMMYSLSQGKSVYLTDVRFPNEVDAIQSIGGKVVRLNISPGFQKELAILRDGFAPNSSSVNHASETSLDNYEGFDVTIKVDDFKDKMDDEVSHIADQLRSIL